MIEPGPSVSETSRLARTLDSNLERLHTIGARAPCRRLRRERDAFERARRRIAELMGFAEAQRLLEIRSRVLVALHERGHVAAIEKYAGTQRRTGLGVVLLSVFLRALQYLVGAGIVAPLELELCERDRLSQVRVRVLPRNLAGLRQQFEREVEPKPRPAQRRRQFGFAPGPRAATVVRATIEVQ